ncbi:MAG TPA: DUF11 domain-containing protein [Actinomycetota bacterium]|nr:DUF11 domain-containing protein [Actinomycetota bacterium]
MRGRRRSEGRSLGRGAQTLVGVALTLLLLAMQAQFVAGAKAKDQKGEPAAESAEAPATDAPAEEAPAEEPPATEEPPAEEPPADEPPTVEQPPATEAPPAEEPPAEEPPADDGGVTSGGGETTGVPAPDASGAATSGGARQTHLREGTGSRQEAARAQAPPPAISCNGAFSGRPEGSLAKTATRDGQSLPDGSVIEAGDVIVFTITWATSDWEGEELDKVLDCVQVNGQDAPQLSVEEKPTANDGVFIHQLTVPENLESGDVLCDRARLSGDPSGDNQSTQKSNSLCFTVTEELSPDVHVRKSASDLEVAPGDHVTYTITVSNDGEGTATDVVVTDDLHNDLVILAIDPEGACVVGAGNTLTCSLGSIGPGDEATITIEASVPADFCGTLRNQAHVSASNEPQEDQDDNDSEEVVIGVLCQPDVNIEKNANIESDPSSGDTFSYTITVNNVGTGTAEDVQITDTFPDGLSVEEALLPENCSLEGNTVTCALGDIPQGDSRSVTITVTVDEDFCGELENTAEVSASNDSNPENNESNTVTLEVECQPDVGVEKSAVIEGNPRPGDTFDFSITVTNVGTGTAEDVVLTDVIQPGLAIEDVPQNCTIEPGEDGETVTCNLGDIEQGDSVTVTITVSVEEDFCGPIENTAEITSPSDSNPENDSDTITFEAECQPDVSVTKSAEVDGDEVDEVPSGSSFTYVITVTNEGTGTVEGVTLSDDLDDNLENVTATPSQGSCVVGSLNTLSCILGDIEQGASVTITIEVDVPADFCGELQNQASVAAENDSNRENNQSDLVSVDVPCGPDIDVRKTNDADADGSFHDEEEALHEGDPVTFRVVITNTGNVAIQLDSLLDEYEETSINPDCLTAEGENVLGMTLEPGESVTCFFTVDDYAPEPNGEIVDVVTAEGHDVQNPETTVSDFDDSTVTTPQVLPRPPVRPRPPQPPAPPGEVLAATGAELALMGLVALALVLAGIVLSYLGRKEDEPGT